jgi:hypothetical protein
MEALSADSVRDAVVEFDEPSATYAKGAAALFRICLSVAICPVFRSSARQNHHPSVELTLFGMS